MNNALRETQDGFVEDYFFLSNFYSSDINVTLHGENFVFSTGEHLFQAYKSYAFVDKNHDYTVKQLRKLESSPKPVLAKRWGRGVSIDVDYWNKISTKAMWRTVSLKFDQNISLRKKLLSTGSLILVEYNDWNDSLWGVSAKTGIGENRLGRLLMRLRKNMMSKQN